VGTRSATQIAAIEFTNSSKPRCQQHAQLKLTITLDRRSNNDKGELIQLTRAILHARSLARFERTRRGGLSLARLSISGYRHGARTHTENTAVLYGSGLRGPDNNPNFQGRLIR